ncbi:hypothetical protein AVEN_172489-1 [Araneus ventricosus]|uniref:Uncharacterized protein n=1 Tax=Araneus ventricosus TaxID=182803 RepID=A0A4Y2DT61_ARAVE|nr:hypothetical protein AVEN_172489-1 [Araneus ventricosus]
MTAGRQTDRLPVDRFCPKFDRNLQIMCQVHAPNFIPVSLIESPCPGGRVSASEPESHSNEDPPYIWACYTLNHTLRAKHPPFGAVRKFERRDTNSGAIPVV